MHCCCYRFVQFLAVAKAAANYLFVNCTPTSTDLSINMSGEQVSLVYFITFIHYKLCDFKYAFNLYSVVKGDF